MSSASGATVPAPNATDASQNLRITSSSSSSRGANTSTMPAGRGGIGRGGRPLAGWRRAQPRSIARQASLGDSVMWMLWAAGDGSGV